MPTSFQVTIWWLEAWISIWEFGLLCLLTYLVLKKYWRNK